MKDDSGKDQDTIEIGQWKQDAVFENQNVIVIDLFHTYMFR